MIDEHFGADLLGRVVVDCNPDESTFDLGAIVAIAMSDGEPCVWVQSTGVFVKRRLTDVQLATVRTGESEAADAAQDGSFASGPKIHNQSATFQAHLRAITQELAGWSQSKRDAAAYYFECLK